MSAFKSCRIKGAAIGVLHYFRRHSHFELRDSGFDSDRQSLVNDMTQTHFERIKQQRVPASMRWVLILAGIYNLLWGAFVIAFPLLPFQWAGMEPPRYPEIWQCVGMIVGVYGIGYLIAASDPIRHWPIVLVGFLGKVFGPIGMVNAIWQGKLPVVAGWTCLTNDIIWWVPFAIILWRAYQAGNANKINFQSEDP